MQWINKDQQQIYSVSLLPITHLAGNMNPDVEIGSNFDEILNPLGIQTTRLVTEVWNALLCQFTQPDSGYHYGIISIFGGFWEIDGALSSTKMTLEKISRILATSTEEKRFSSRSEIKPYDTHHESVDTSHFVSKSNLDFKSLNFAIVCRFCDYSIVTH